MSQNASALERAKQSVAVERTTTAMPVEVGSTAASAQVKAMVEARFVMAVKRPRNMEQVRQDLLKECSRPSFALEDIEGNGNSALYRRPVGGGKTVEGLGIRFAEVAIRCMTNVMVSVFTIQEDEMQRVKYCSVLDLETNDSWEDTVHISKTVERRETRSGDIVISSRTNSTGQVVYTIKASEDALAVKEAALISKKLRTLAMRLIAGDLQDACIAEIKRVRREKITEDPDAAIRRVTDGMAKQHVTVIMLEEYLEHPVAQCTTAEIVNLQGLYAALRDGETTWSEIMADAEEFKKLRPDSAKKEKKRGVEAAKEKIAAEPVKPASTQPAPAQKPVTTPTAETTQAPAQPEPVAPVVETPTEPAPKAQSAVMAEAPPWATTAPAAPQPAAQPAPTTQAPAPPAQAEQPAQPKPVVVSGGRVVKGVQFPEVLTRTSDADAFTEEQLQRARTAIQNLAERKNKKLSLEGTIKSFFQLELNDISGQTLECVIQVLNEWQ